MHVEQRKLDQIRPYEKNPRINAKAVDAVAKSITEFGFRQPIVVDVDGVIVVGHTRYLAARKLNLKAVPFHVATELTPDQAKAYRIADNQSASLSEWDMDLLPLELLGLQDVGFDMDLLGFDAKMLTQLLERDTTDGQTDPDDIPQPHDEAITQPGDLWTLGDHRLLCGDSGSPQDLDRLLGGQRIHMVNTDPPYNVKVEPRSNNAIAAGLSSFAGAKHHQKFDVRRHPEKAKGTTKKLRPKDRPLANDFVSDEAFDQMLMAWFGNISRALLPGRCFYIWGGYANCANYPAPLAECGLYFSQSIIWDKQHPVLTRKDYMGAHEWCQPSDTKVLTPDGQVPISELRDGDRVFSFDTHSTCLVGSEDGVAVRVASRQYQGDLIGVGVGDCLTWCTPDHHWTIRLSEGAAPPRRVHASDLRAKAMQVPVVVPGSDGPQWRPIQTLSRRTYSSTVYSLAVDKHEHYIADGIVTHNCFYGWREGAAHQFYGPNNVSDLWAIKKVNPQSMVHLTEKPVELAVRAIQYSSKTGENVLDLFGGSRSTLIACEQTGRHAFLMELDPPYCDVIVHRWEAFTSRKAVRDSVLAVETQPQPTPATSTGRKGRARKMAS